LRGKEKEDRRLCKFIRQVYKYEHQKHGCLGKQAVVDNKLGITKDEQETGSYKVVCTFNNEYLKGEES